LLLVTTNRGCHHAPIRRSPAPLAENGLMFPTL